MPYKDPEKARARSRRYRIEHKEQIAQAKKIYQELHKEEIAAYQAAWHLANREKCLAQMKVYDASHKTERRLREQTQPEEIKARKRTRNALYRVLHRDSLKLKRHLFYLANKGKFFANNVIRRTRMKEVVVNDLTNEQWLEIQEVQKHKCYYCGNRCKGHLTQDHIIPLVRGGGHTLHNVIAACKACNSKKQRNHAPIPVQPLLLTLAPAKKQKD